MKVRAKVDVTDEPHRRAPDWPVDRETHVSIVLVIENAARGDAVLGTVDKSWAGIRHALEESLRRR